MPAGVVTPYSTVAPLFGALPGWVPQEDQERIASYLVYEDMYWNRPETFKLVMRGSEDQPIYVPTGRIIVDTTNRYVGKGFNYFVDPTMGTPETQGLANAWFKAFFRREKFISKYNMNKRFGLIRGDWIWHIIADPTKPPGRRISVRAVDPASWFPVYDDNDLDRMTKIHLAEQFVDMAGKTWVKRLTYEKLDNGTIQSSEGIFEMKEWWLADQPTTVTLPPAVLPPQITAFPVYHIKNFEEPQNPYGSSELRGVEIISAAINQAVSDEDLALALQGLGVYSTSGGGPVDDDGNETDWIISPGRVLENVMDFKRVDGVTTVQPSQDHIQFLLNMMKESSGTPDAAIGKVDVSVAESGISLALQLGPMLAKAEEKDQEIIDVHTQMFYDLKQWFLAYEGVNFTDADIVPILGDKLPTNVEAEIDKVVKMVTAGLMSAETGRAKLAQFGIVFAKDEGALIIAEKAAQTTAETPVDANAARMDAELATLGGSGESDPAAGF